MERRARAPFGCASTNLLPTPRIISTSCSKLVKRALETTCRRTLRVSSAACREPTICLKFRNWVNLQGRSLSGIEQTVCEASQRESQQSDVAEPAPNAFWKEEMVDVAGTRDEGVRE